MIIIIIMLYACMSKENVGDTICTMMHPKHLICSYLLCMYSFMYLIMEI